MNPLVEPLLFTVKSSTDDGGVLSPRLELVLEVRDGDGEADEVGNDNVSVLSLMERVLLLVDTPLSLTMVEEEFDDECPPEEL